MLQRDELLEWRNIYRNVLIGPEIQRSLTPEVRKRAHELLDAYGLGQFKDSRPSELIRGNAPKGCSCPHPDFKSGSTPA